MDILRLILPLSLLLCVFENVHNSIKHNFRERCRWSSQLMDSSFTTEMAYMCLPHKPLYLIAPFYCNPTLKKNKKQKNSPCMSIIELGMRYRNHSGLAQTSKSSCFPGTGSQEVRRPDLCTWSMKPPIPLCPHLPRLRPGIAFHPNGHANEMHLWAPHMWEARKPRGFPRVLIHQGRQDLGRGFRLLSQTRAINLATLAAEEAGSWSTSLCSIVAAFLTT